MARAKGSSITNFEAWERLSGDVRAKEPPTGIREKILGSLGFDGKRLKIKSLPEINKYTNHLSWLEVIDPLIPEQPVKIIFMRELRRDDKIVQTLVITRVDVAEETHESYTESFFILKGRCVCTVGGNVFELGPGNYLSIPPYIPHDVRLLTPEVTAILQYQLI
ncbi:cupin domain-containing protein [Mucilaginibacter lutimaris]|uniref:Cupin domain-containing protein n=1 Tax=Mucilaginibacter lutimaris TaxID=931629 RepID=A0ABW2ZE19_9SPHI